MANLVEFIVKIRDLASGQFGKIASSGEGAFKRISSRVSSASLSIDQLNAKIDALSKTRTMSVDTSQIRRTGRELDQLERKRDALEQSGRSGGGFGGGMMWAAVAAAGFAIKDMFSKGVERQMNQVAFEVLAGKKDGDQLNRQELRFAKDTIYGNEAFGEGKLMLGSGVAEKNVMPIQNMIGDIAMGDAERMKSITLAFSEASSTGHLTGRQELMMRTALFNPLEQLHKMSGKSVAALEKNMSKGKIGINELVKSMEYATGPMGRWHNMMQKMQETPAGKWHAFTGTIATMAGTIGLKLLPVMGKLTDFLTGLISNAPALYAVGAAIGAMTIAWGAYTVVTNWAAIATWALNTALWPILGIGAIVGILAFVAIGYAKYADSAMTSADNITDANGRILSSTDLLTKNLNGQVTVTTGKMENFFFNLKNMWLHIESFFERINNAMGSGADKGKTGFAAWASAARNFGKALTGETKSGKEIDDRNNAREWHRAMESQGLDDNGKPKSKSPLDGYGKYTPGGTGSGVPDGVSDTDKGITGGGVRNLTINIAKQGIDRIDMHVANLKEGKEEIQNMFIEMFNQVVNSGNAAVSPK